MGLKSYDLIWVDGKSAAWRYPGEIEELKSFAPPVEEQPYDRFYKKAETATSAKNQEAGTNTSVTHTEPAIQQPEKPAPKKEKEYKRVFVTLPSNAGATGANGNHYSNGNGGAVNASPAKPVEKPSVPPVEKKQEYSQYMPQESAKETTTPIAAQSKAPAYFPEKKQTQPEPAPVKKQPAYKQPVAAEQELPEEMYFPRKKTSRIKPIAIAAVAIVMVSMVALGIWIGLSLDSKPQSASLEKKTDRVPANTQQNGSGLIGGATENNTEPIVAPDSLENKQAVLSAQVKKPVRTPVASDPDHLTDSLKQTAAIEKNDSGDVAKEEPRVKKPVVSKPTMPELEKMVSVSSNDYKVGPFGGISKLALTVTNSSAYSLNLVVVQVEYLKVNKEVFKTENLYFRDLAANSSLTLDAPKSNRGNTVNYKVTLINSKDHLFHAGN